MDSGVKQVFEKFDNLQRDPGTVHIQSETWYHSTDRGPAEQILQNGFKLTTGTRQQFGQGVYLLEEPRGQFGDTMLEVTTSGKFVDFRDDRLASEWADFKSEHLSDARKPSERRERMLKLFDGVCGTIVGETMVIYRPDRCIDSIKRYEGERL